MSLIYDQKAIIDRVAGTPMEFAGRHGSSIRRARGMQEWVKTICSGDLESLDHDMIYRSLSKQLGTPWRGWHAMSTWRQALVSILAEPGDGRLDMAHRMGLSLPSESSIELTDKVRAFVDDRVKGHAFETTAMLNLMNAEDIESGPSIPSMALAWIAPHDPIAWVLLLNRGRPTPLPDVAGIVAHHAVEKILGKPVSTPSFSTMPSAIMNWAACQTA